MLNSREKYAQDMDKHAEYIDKHPEYFGFDVYYKEIKNDLINFYGHTNNIKIYFCSENSLPSILDYIPECLLNVSKPEYFKLRFHYFDSVNQEYLSECGTRFLIKNDNYWIYGEHFPGSGSGYICCECLNIFIAENLENLRPHIEEKYIIDLIPKEKA